MVKPAESPGAAPLEPYTLSPVGLEGRTVPADDEPRPARRLVFSIVSIALLMSAVDQTIVATALPSIQHDLHARVNWSSWTITIYALGQIVAMPLAGALSDHYGRKRVFLTCAFIFTLASLCCGLATNIYVLVSLRAVQALGGGGLMPSATGIVSDHYGRERDRALGMFSSIFPIGAVVGPVLGGVFVTHWSWRGIFLVNIPIGIVLIALSMKFIPTTRSKETAYIDLKGVSLLGGLLVSGMYGAAALGSGHTSIWDPTFICSEALAVMLGVAFVRHVKHSAKSFMPPLLLFGRGFALMNLINFLFGSALLGFGALVPLYAVDRYGIGALAAGTLLVARAVGMICLAAVAAMLLRRSGYRLPITIGLIVSAGGLTLMAVGPRDASAYTWLALAAAITGIGMGMTQPALNNAMMYLAPSKVAAVAGLRGMFRQAGGITAVAVTTAIVARSANPGVALGHAFVVFGVIILVTVPLIFRLPEHHGRW